MKSQGPNSRYAKQALGIFGAQIRVLRLEQGISAEVLAERAGVSRGLVHRVETGDPGVSMGAAFELAAVLGLPLFEDEPSRLGPALKRTETTLKLLPKAARRPRKAVNDDF